MARTAGVTLTANRRQFLRTALLAGVGVAAGPALLSACSSGDGATESNTINLMTFEGFNFPDAMAEFEEKNGLEVNLTAIASQDDVQAKLLAGGSNINLISYFQAYGRIYEGLGILQPLDESKIPNLANLYPVFQTKEPGLFFNADGERIGVPFHFGVQSMVYDSGKMEEPESYDQLFDAQYTGKVVMMDDATANFMLGAHILGYDVGELTDAQFDEVSNYLQRMVKQTRGVAPTYGDAANRMAAGDAIVAFAGYPGMTVLAADAGNANVKSVVPSEGGYAYTDAWAIPKGADETALPWINETLDPKVNAAGADSIVDGGTVQGITEFMTGPTKDAYDYANLEASIAKSPFYSIPPAESDEFVTFSELIDRWQSVKSGA